MACFVPSLGFIVLLGFVTTSAAYRDTCDLYATVGQNLTLPFVYERLESRDNLQWIHNNKFIFKRHQGRVTFGKPDDVSVTGSLLLKTLKSSSAGLYQADVSYPNGTLAKTWTGYLCLMDKVTKPYLSFVCDYKSGVVTLNCHVAKPQDVMFSWTLDERPFSETRSTGSITLSLFKEWGGFTCAAANKVSKEKSDIVRPMCKKPSPSPPPLLCFTSKAVVAVLAGGVSVILLLLFIIIITLCCCYRRNKTTKSKGTGQLRMLSLTPRSADPVSSDYETMHASEPSPLPRYWNWSCLCVTNVIHNLKH
uniref:Ig-like domain-containing protein n=1 Tax=Sphaeramia orbicularis TaxID=375764 RepID=A0A672ZRS2_9TELE